jgi:hypothetical protein
MIVSPLCTDLLQVKASTPVLMCSVPGFDASGRVEDLAAELNKQITSIAIGMWSSVQHLKMCGINMIY